MLIFWDVGCNKVFVCIDVFNKYKCIVYVDVINFNGVKFFKGGKGKIKVMFGIGKGKGKVKGVVFIFFDIFIFIFVIVFKFKLKFVFLLFFIFLLLFFMFFVLVFDEDLILDFELVEFIFCFWLWWFIVLEGDDEIEVLREVRWRFLRYCLFFNYIKEEDVEEKRSWVVLDELVVDFFDDFVVRFLWWSDEDEIEYRERVWEYLIDILRFFDVDFLMEEIENILLFFVLVIVYIIEDFEDFEGGVVDVLGRSCW